jgi:lysophospholipase L1-like esterase
MYFPILHWSVALITAFVSVLGARTEAADKAPLSTRFEPQIIAFETRDKGAPPSQGAILLTGASNIVRWKSFAEDLPGYQVINRGFGGSHLADVAHYADRVIIPYRPKMVIVQGGGNDLNSGKTPEEVLRDAQTLVSKIRTALPETRIAFVSISPSIARWNQREKQAELNKLLSDFLSQGDKLDFIDVNEMFLGPDGKPRAELFVADGLHLSEAGFKARAKLILPYLPPRDTSKE